MSVDLRGETQSHSLRVMSCMLHAAPTANHQQGPPANQGGTWQKFKGHRPIMELRILVYFVIGCLFDSGMCLLWIDNAFKHPPLPPTTYTSNF